MGKTFFVRLKDLIRRFMYKMDRDRVRAHSAEAAFFIIMSFFPILSVR